MIAQAQYALLGGQVSLQLLQELAARGIMAPKLSRITRRKDEAQANFNTTLTLFYLLILYTL
jgi:hypothetical protein